MVASINPKLRGQRRSALSTSYYWLATIPTIYEYIYSIYEYGLRYEYVWALRDLHPPQDRLDLCRRCSRKLSCQSSRMFVVLVVSRFHLSSAACAFVGSSVFVALAVLVACTCCRTRFASSREGHILMRMPPGNSRAPA